MSRVYERLPPGDLTYEDYVGLPDDGRRYEIIDGELEVSPAPAPRHQGVSRNLVVLLHGHVQARGLGTIYYAPIDVILARDSIVQPDLVFVAAARESIVTERAIEGPPDLVVEILSPWSDRRDRVTKAELYARYGVRHYWIVDPVARTLRMYEPKRGASRPGRRSRGPIRRGAKYRLVATHKGATVAHTSLFPDLEIDLARIWV
jgi:Uma2 family endonuclease